jgi:replicative DNA helicase
VSEVFTRETVTATETPRLTRLGDLLDAWRTDAEAAFLARTQGTARGPVTGLPKLDRVLGDVLSPGSHVLHGAPGTGKTALALQIAGSCGCPCLFLSAEMSALELFRRVTARATGVYLGRLKSGELAPDDSLKHAQQAAAAVPDLTIADATRAFASVAWLHQAAAIVRGDGRHLLLVVDSAHSWSEAMPGDADEYTRLGVALASLRTLARTLDCPVLVVAERNRASMQKGGISAAAGHRSFEYGAESMLELTRDMTKAPDAVGEVAIGVKVVKNRNGVAGEELSLRFNGALQRFTEA